MWYWSPYSCMLIQSLRGFRSITMSYKYLGETYLWELQVGQLVAPTPSEDLLNDSCIGKLKVWFLLILRTTNLFPFCFSHHSHSHPCYSFTVLLKSLWNIVWHIQVAKKKKKLINGINWRLMDNFVTCFSSRKYSGESKIGRCYFRISVSHCDSWWLKMSFIFMS